MTKDAEKGLRKIRRGYHPDPRTKESLTDLRRMGDHIGEAQEDEEEEELTQEARGRKRALEEGGRDQHQNADKRRRKAAPGSPEECSKDPGQSPGKPSGLKT